MGSESSTHTIQKPVNTAAKGKALTAGWICFALGLVLMFVSLGTFFLYGPLLFAAFILSIVAMAQGRVLAGILLLLVTLAVPTTTWVGLFALRVGETLVEQQEEREEASLSIAFEEVEGYIDGDYMYCKGKVRNTGSQNAKFVKVGVEWLDKNGRILDTDYTYAVGSEGLRPGAAKSFRIMTETDRRMKRYRYYLLED